MNSVVGLGFKVVFDEKIFAGYMNSARDPSFFQLSTRMHGFCAFPNACIIYSYKLENIIYKCKLQKSNHII